jgi:hypothetical protein
MLMVWLAAVATATDAHADDGGRLLDDDSFAVHSTGSLLVDGGLVLVMPAGLPTGMSSGVGAGVSHDCTCWFSYGARLSASTVTESSEAWTVYDWDFRLRVTAGLHHRFGRGEIGFRVGAGTTLVREDRTRNEGMRAGLTGSALESVEWAALPAGEVEGVVALHLFGPWLMIASGGPAADVLDSTVHGGWVAQLSVGWQP